LIDNPDQAARLLEKLRAALPLPACLIPELAATLGRRSAANSTPQICSITWVGYTGDDGGIVCRLDFTQNTREAAIASITHLRFDARMKLAREIAAYQKHRIKRLRRQLS